MVHGIATNNKRYEHKKMNDEKWLSEDMLVWKRYVERDMQKLVSKNKKETNESLKDSKKKTLTVIRILQILILGVFGPITLIGGLYVLIKENYVVGIPFTIIGAIFVIALILNEKYR
jgi:hypothetical protein